MDFTYTNYKGVNFPTNGKWTVRFKDDSAEEIIIDWWSDDGERQYSYGQTLIKPAVEYADIINDHRPVDVIMEQVFGIGKEEEVAATPKQKRLDAKPEDFDKLVGYYECGADVKTVFGGEERPLGEVIKAWYDAWYRQHEYNKRYYKPDNAVYKESEKKLAILGAAWERYQAAEKARKKGSNNASDASAAIGNSEREYTYRDAR